MIQRALIITVGTGTRPDVNIVRPLVKTIKDSRPDFLVLLATEASRGFGEEILAHLQWPAQNQMTVILKEFDDFQAVFREVNQVFRELREKGYTPEEIQLDFTSGTKAMSSGAVSAGIYHQCQSLKYITGERRHGVVVNGSEKFLTVNPSAIYARHDLQLAHELILRLRFVTAGEILASLNADLLDPQEQGLRQNLRLAAQGYRAWDIFNHKEAGFRLGKVSWEGFGVIQCKPAPAAFSLLDTLAGEENQARTHALLLDLYNNAWRRGQEGKYDDGVARLYRAAELFAQQVLHFGFGIDSGDVALDKTPVTLHERLEKNRDDLDGKIKIGLHLDYLLLEELGHPVGNAFMDNASLRGRLKERNQSILAHGHNPVSQSLFNKLCTDLLNLFHLALPDFEKQAAEVQFPWL
jgi:CRISPR-associated protein (TIGR02710 family)